NEGEFGAVFQANAPAALARSFVGAGDLAEDLDGVLASSGAQARGTAGAGGDDVMGEPGAARAKAPAGFASESALAHGEGAHGVREASSAREEQDERVVLGENAGDDAA